MTQGVNPRPRRAGRLLLIALVDVLLLPLAIIVVLFDDVLWEAAQRLLRWLERVGVLRSARSWVGRLPAAAVLPLFLLPETISHLSGFLGAFLLAKGQLTAAILLLVLVKGLATIAVVWIYQAASGTLLAIGWFAWIHNAVQYVRAWSLSQVIPLRHALRAWSARFGRGSGVLRRRFKAVRTRLAARLGGLWTAL
jgi:hypothetical protein